jgi:surface polysaccharide O-acyltransferase-like enzyme
MFKRLYILSGLAIVAVVANHAAGWGFTAMFWWTDRYRAVAVPDFSDLGSVEYYLLAVLKQLTLFSVPTFLFITGFFVAYAYRSASGKFTWKTARTRIVSLILPYVLWSGAIFVLEAAVGNVLAPVEYARRLLVGGAIEPYYYIIVICQLYLAAPILAPLARSRGRWLILFSAAVQLATIGLNYLSLFTPRDPLPTWLCTGWVLFFSIGLVMGFHLDQLKSWLERARGALAATAVVLAVLAILEPEVIFRFTGRDWHGQISLPTSAYAITALLSLLAIDEAAIPQTKALTQLGSRTLGIYLIHPIALRYTAKLLYHAAPLVLGQQLLFVALLIAAGLGVPLLLMVNVTRTPARQYYSLLFG